MLGLPLTFAAPLVLTALAALPAIWLLLRITPPQPRRVDFPPLRILADLLPERETPARTPWWLLLLRLVLAALPHPRGRRAGLESERRRRRARRRILLLVDNGFPAAHDWRERLAIAVERIEAAEREGRVVALVGLGRPARPIEPSQSGGGARAGADIQAAAAPSRPRAHLEAIGRFLDRDARCRDRLDQRRGQRRRGPGLHR